MSDSLARLSLLKSTAYLNETGYTKEDELKAVLIAASEIVSVYCGRPFARETYTEYYTGNDTARLYLNNPPVIEVKSVELWDGSTQYDTEDAADYQVFNDYIQYPKLGRETYALWSSWYSAYDGGIRIKYVGGYDCTDWDTKGIGDAFGVPADLEHVTCQIAMKIWKDSTAGGGRFGLSSLSRDGGATFDKFFKGLPDDTLMVLNQHRRFLI